MGAGVEVEVLKQRIRNEMSILCSEGDTKVIWDPDVPVEVEVARQMFEKLRAEGYSAFEATAEGGRGRRVDTFDPQSKALIMVPRLVGG